MLDKEKTKFFTIYSQRLAGYLMQRGFPLIKLVENKNNKNSFLFKNSTQLQDAMDEWQICKLERQKLY